MTGILKTDTLTALYYRVLVHVCYVYVVHVKTDVSTHRHPARPVSVPMAHSISHHF